MAAGFLRGALCLSLAAALGGIDAAASPAASGAAAPAQAQYGANATDKPVAAVVKTSPKENTFHGSPLPAQPAPVRAPAAAPATRTALEAGQFTRSASGKFDFHARDMDVAEAFGQLRRLLHRNIIVSSEVVRRFSGDLYEVTADEAVQAICRSTGLQAHEEGTFLYIGPAELQSRIFHLSYIRAEDIAPLVQPALSPQGTLTTTITAESGITPSQEHAGGDAFSDQDALSVLDYPRNLDAVAELVRSFDVRPRQILIEATILAASLNDDLQYGVNFTALHGIDLSTATANFATQTVNIGSLTLDQTKGGAGSAQTDLVRGLATEGLKFGFFNGGVGAFVRALQSRTAVDILATPRVITLNKQRGEVLLGRRDGYLTSTVTQTSTTQNVQFLETGTRLVYRPFIASDGYVRLEIHPEDSNGGLNPQGLPYKDTAELTTNVLVKDSDTLVIGGLFRSRKMTVDKKVPWLGDIPFLGELFKSQDHVTVREEIVVLLTPHILDGDTGVYSKNGAKNAVTSRTEVANPRDTERLAQSYLDAAHTRLENRDPAGAMILVDAAVLFGSKDPSIESLRGRAGRSLVVGSNADAIDDLIMNKVLRDAAEERARETSR